MEASLSNFHFPSSHQQQQNGGKRIDGHSAVETQKQTSQRLVNGQHGEPKSTSQGYPQKPQSTVEFQGEDTLNGLAQGTRHPGIFSGRDCSRAKPNGNGDKDLNTQDIPLPSGAPSGDLHLRLHGTRPGLPSEAPAALVVRHSSSGSNNTQSPRHATAMNHGPHRLPTSISSISRHRHTHGGVSSSEGGYFFSSPKQAQPYPLRLSRNGAAVAASAAAAVAAARPYPGAFIRYVVVPLLLLPFAWPWLLLRCAQALLSVICLLAAVTADGLIMLADLLRRNRSNAEVLTTWAAGWLAWIVTSYWAVLAQLHMGCEDFLSRLTQLLAPLLAALLSRSPAAARVARLILPAFSVAAKGQAALYGAYCFVHDEIVPVAFDLAERIPVVHWLLHRAVEGGRA